jgi:hypothetical protein
MYLGFLSTADKQTPEISKCHPCSDQRTSVKEESNIESRKDLNQII